MVGLPGVTLTRSRVRYTGLIVPSCWTGVCVCVSVWFRQYDVLNEKSAKMAQLAPQALAKSPPIVLGVARSAIDVVDVR